MLPYGNLQAFLSLFPMKNNIAYQTTEFLTINKKLIQYYGPVASIFLSILINNIDSDGWAKLSLPVISFQMGITEAKINYCRKLLMEDGFLEIRKKGMPATFQYKIDIDKLYRIINS